MYVRGQVAVQFEIRVALCRPLWPAVTQVAAGFMGAELGVQVDERGHDPWLVVLQIQPWQVNVEILGQYPCVLAGPEPGECEAESFSRVDQFARQQKFADFLAVLCSP